MAIVKIVSENVTDEDPQKHPNEVHNLEIVSSKVGPKFIKSDIGSILAARCWQASFYILGGASLAITGLIFQVDYDSPS